LYGGLDVLEDVREVMDDDHRASGIDVEVTCEDCNETFLVTDVDLTLMITFCSNGQAYHV
jgi:hypothetical protein